MTSKTKKKGKSCQDINNDDDARVVWFTLTLL